MADLLASSSTALSTPSSASALDQRLSLDVQSVDALRRTARNSPQEGLRQASRQFEALFMGMMLKSMRDATPSEGMLSSEAGKTYTGMLDQQLTQKLSGRGLGLAEAMYAQLSKNLGATPAPDPAPNPGPATLPAGSALVPALPVSSASPASPASPASLASPRLPLQAPSQGAALGRVPALAGAGEAGLYEQVTAQASYSRSALAPGLVEDFVARLLPAAQRASQASGLPAQLIMAQAALESGWGRREPRSSTGEPSFNLFGIKADKAWKGAVVQASTTEYVNGAPQKVQANFRAYGSYDEAFADHARFLASNPRYSALRGAPDAAEAAHGLQRAGYATDPDYGSKLVRLMKQMS